jgi:hypothetical protein
MYLEISTISLSFNCILFSTVWQWCTSLIQTNRSPTRLPESVFKCTDVPVQEQHTNSHLPHFQEVFCITSLFLQTSQQRSYICISLQEGKDPAVVLCACHERIRGNEDKLHSSFTSALEGARSQLHYLNAYRISQPIRRTFFPEKCNLNSTCVLCAEGKIY